MTAATQNRIDVHIDELPAAADEMARQIKAHERNCRECDGGVTCAKGQRELEAFLRVYMDQRREQLKSRVYRATTCTRAGRVVVTARLATPIADIT